MMTVHLSSDSLNGAFFPVTIWTKVLILLISLIRLLNPPKYKCGNQSYEKITIEKKSVSSQTKKV